MSKIYKLTLFLLISLFFINHNSTGKEYDETSSQKHFTSIIRGLPGVVSATWESPISLWIKASSKAVGSPPSQNKAQTLANILAERGRTALRQPFCVHIYQRKDRELAKSCVY